MQKLMIGQFHLLSWLLAAFLFGGMLLLLELGYRNGIRSRAREGAKQEGLGTLEGGVFGLMGLLLAFSFSGAASRFDDRRKLIVEEANDIGTTWLRLDLLPVAAQAAVKDSFRNYVDARIATYRAVPDYDAAMAFMKRSEELQGVIWNQAVTATRDGWVPAANLLLPALNSTFDISTTRKYAALTHPPLMLYGLLLMLVLMSSWLAGYGMAASSTRKWSHAITFIVLVSLTIWVIFDLEYPRLGFIRVDNFDQAILDVRASMK